MDSHEGGAARLLGRRCPRALSFSIDKILQPDFGCQRNGHVLPRVRAGFFNRSTGFHSAAWSSLSGDNPTKEGGNTITDDLFHSIRGLLDVEEVTFSYPGIFDFNGYFEKEKTEKLIPTVLEQNSIYFSTPKFLIQSNDCPKEFKKLDNSWSPNSQYVCNDPELSFTPTKPGDFVLAQAWSFSNADSVLPSSSPPSKSRKAFSACEKETESLIVPKFDGVNNSLVADSDLQEVKKAVTANSCIDKIAVSPENTIKESFQPKNNSLADDVTSSTDTSPIRRSKEPRLNTPESFLANVSNQDSASSTNFEKMQLPGRTVDLKVPLCASSNSMTAAAINTKTETEAKRGEGSSNYSFPAWLYCTRYSDRPSSGPRCRRKKKHQIDGDEKRSRTAFSSAQLARLRQEFQTNRYLTEKRRTTLATELDLSESQVKIWFQNKRAKLKKSAGRKNPLALQLMAQGLYNHTSQK